MTAGRPPVWNPFSTLPAKTWTEALVVTDRARVSLPIEVRRRLEIKGARRWLADMAASGRANLVAWEHEGKEVIAKVQATLLAANATPELALAAMDRFQVVTMVEEGRLTLPTGLLAHLDAAATGVIRMVADRSTLVLWSEAAWREGRPERLALLDEALRRGK